MDKRGKLFLILGVFFLCAGAFAQAGDQVIVGAEGQGIDATTKAKYFTLTPQASSPIATEARLYYDNAGNVIKYYDGTAWQSLGGGGTGDKTAATKIMAASNSQGTTGCPGACTNPRADTTCSGTQTTGGDEVTINAAIDALATTGGAVYLLEGNYWVTDRIRVRSNVAIIGAGTGTIISPKNSVTFGYGVITNYGAFSGSDTNILLTNFKIDGNKANGATGQYGVYFYKVTNSKIDKLWVENMKVAGIYLYTSCNYNILSGNNVRANDSTGILLSTSCTNNILSGNNVQANSGNGIHIAASSSNNTISGNNVQSNSKGIWLETSCSYNILSGNNVRANYGDGIYLFPSASNYNIISGNNVQTNGGTGIYLYSSSNNILSGNNVQSNGSRGVSIYSAGTRNILSGNTIYDNGGTGSSEGIYINDNSDNNIISSNLLYDSDATGRPINIVTNTCDNNYIVGNLISSWPASYKEINDSGPSGATGTKYTDKVKMTLEKNATISTLSGTNQTLTPSSLTSYVLVRGSTGAGSTTVSNIYATNQSAGNILIIQGDTSIGGGTYYDVTFNESGNIALGANRPLEANDILVVIWDGAKWTEVSFSNVS